MTDLTKEEQENVRVALRFLRIRFGIMANMAKALHVEAGTLRGALSGRESISASVTMRVARLVQVGIDDLLAGKYPVKGTCPHCGRGPG